MILPTLRPALFALVAAFAISAAAASAQTPAIHRSLPLVEASPQDVGMSPARIDRIDDMLREAVQNDDIPGVVALVARHGKIVYWEAYGMADNEAGVPMAKDTIFRIASQSKAITSTAVMMLWEQGLFRLDDPISRYIPEFKDPQVLSRFSYGDTTFTGAPADREITIRHLLSHTSGLGYGVIDGDERFRMMYEKAGVTDLFTTKNISIEESVRRLATLPLHHNPGEGFTYSEGLDVLGYFIELISGQPFDEYLQEHIFEPLGMTDTAFYLPADKADRLVTVQRPSGDGGWERYPVTFYDTDYPIKGARRFFSGGAGLSSTAKDYATFLQMYLNGGELNGFRLLSRTTVDVIMANQVGDLMGADSGSFYGLAFGGLDETGQAKGGRGTAGTFSWGGYFNTQYFADPGEGIVAVVFKQTQGRVSDQTGWKFSVLVGQAVDD
jgi:CubicO group peptidase (beta-lactamase class C family)